MVIVVAVDPDAYRDFARIHLNIAVVEPRIAQTCKFQVSGIRQPRHRNSLAHSLHLTPTHQMHVHMKNFLSAVGITVD